MFVKMADGARTEGRGRCKQGLISPIMPQRAELGFARNILAFFFFNVPTPTHTHRPLEINSQLLLLLIPHSMEKTISTVRPDLTYSPETHVPSIVTGSLLILQAENGGKKKLREKSTKHFPVFILRSFSTKCVS